MKGNVAAFLINALSETVDSNLELSWLSKKLPSSVVSSKVVVNMVTISDKAEMLPEVELNADLRGK
jgi:hypothetical protein